MIYYAWQDSSELPATPDFADSQAVNLGIRFQVTEACTVKAIRFYMGRTGYGPFVGTLWGAGGAWQGASDATSPGTIGWVQLDLTTPVAVSPGTTYTASFFSPMGLYAFTSNYFNVTGKTVGPLKLLQNTEAGGNGVFRYDSVPAVPTSSFNAGNYWVDVVVETADGTVITLLGSNCTQANTASTGAVTQNYALAGSNSSKASTSSSGSISLEYALTVAGSSLGKASATAAITQTYSLAGSSSVSSKTASSGAVSLVIGLTGASGTRSNTCTSGAISQTYVLISENSAKAMTSSSGAVSLAYNLTAANSVQRWTSDSVAIFLGTYAPLGKLHVAVTYMPYVVRYVGSPYAVTVAPQPYKVTHER